MSMQRPPEQNMFLIVFKIEYFFIPHYMGEPREDYPSHNPLQYDEIRYWL